MKKILLLLFLLISTFGYSQLTTSKGYVLTDENGFIDGLNPYADYNTGAVSTTFGSVTEGKAVVFGVQEAVLGIPRSGTGDTTFSVTHAGVYMITGRAECDISSGSGIVNAWLEVGGSAIANSNHCITVTNAINSELYFSFIYTFAAGNTFRIKVLSDDTNMTLMTAVASGVKPATVAVEMHIRRISTTP